MRRAFKWTSLEAYHERFMGKSSLVRVAALGYEVLSLTSLSDHAMLNTTHV